VPVERFTYRPTRQPVILDWWEPPGPPADPLRFTTVASWEQGFKDIEFGGEVYTWSKSAEFRKVLDLPGRVPVRLELALALDDEATLAELRAAGWAVRPAAPLSDDPDAYRDYIQGSGGEFTAAKDQNVRLRSGWFSDRTATYLAAGRPAVVQDTGFDCALPVGEGLLAWRDGEEAAAALAEVAGDPDRHARAARAIAAEHFRAETVVGELLDEVGA
jgi:glycosyltransferase involved in cell wall biosynthesis